MLLGQARRQPDHVLLCDTDVEKPIGEALGEWLEHRKSAVAREEHDSLVALSKVHQRREEFLPHAVTSATARPY